MKRLLATGLLWTCAALPALAQEAPKPAPELDKLKTFLGTWHCEGDMAASPFGPAHKSKATVSIKSGLGGFWISGTVKEEKLPGNPMPAMEGVFHQGWDATAKQYVMLWVDNFGAWSKETSPGWVGDKMSWEGESSMMGKTVPMRDHFTKKGENELVHTFEMSQDGKWMSLGTETCQRAPGGAK